jgi:hypothetical protein
MEHTHDQVTQSLRIAALSLYVANPDRLPPDVLANWLWDQAFSAGADEMVHGETHYGTEAACPWCQAERHHRQAVEPLHATCRHCLQPIAWRPGPAYVTEADGTSVCRRQYRTGPHEPIPAQEGNG